ncbi:MAG TPA: ribosome biogenesis GTP-binding protein YihA/YsxC [Gemmatimonadota bacterium]|nr:ribosome biogenesis GTP-binding protein YihA/YsxC [Gemmatimonadota bacterium]
MEVHEVHLVRTTTDPDDHPSPPRPEVAFVGRSNVGKSSLLNALCRNRRLARVSRTPGKTQTINYFDVGGTCYFVDLPGYGYAAVPDEVRRSWGPMIEAYLERSSRLAGVVSLVDGRHEPTALDQRMVAWLAERGIPTLVALTKADRVPHGRRRARLEETAQALGLDPEQIVWFSSRSGEGRDAVFSAVDSLLRQEVP